MQEPLQTEGTRMLIWPSKLVASVNKTRERDIQPSQDIGDAIPFSKGGEGRARQLPSKLEGVECHLLERIFASLLPCLF